MIANISNHILYEEAIKSQMAKRLGIDNNVYDPMILENMKLVAEKCFEPARAYFGKPIIVNSFYRCPELNKAVKGAPNSQHLKGQAIDIDTGDKYQNMILFGWMKDNLKFDQLINEYDFSWIHVSYKKQGNRNQILEIK